jgi:hypothetical protein
MVKWGVFDTVDECWMGNSKGPLSYDDEKLAQVAAMVMDMRINWQIGRCRARVLPHPLPWRLRDTKDTRMSTVDALERLEKGEL